jgi:hypothetical protein
MPQSLLSVHIFGLYFTISVCPPWPNLLRAPRRVPLWAATSPTKESFMSNMYLVICAGKDLSH